MKNNKSINWDIYGIDKDEFEVRFLFFLSIFLSGFQFVLITLDKF